MGARGSVFRDPPPEAVRGDRCPRATKAAGTPEYGRGHLRADPNEAPRGEDQGRGLGPAQAPVLDLRKDCAQRKAVRRDLRPRWHSCRSGVRPRLLRGPRRVTHPLYTRPRAIQGLHRDAQVQYVPITAHHGYWSDRASDGDPDPHAGYAQSSRVRDRRTLALQGAEARPRLGG